MIKLLKILWIIFLFFAFFSVIHSESLFPRLTPSDYVDRYKGRLDNLSLTDLIDISLYFSGVEEDEFNDYQLKFTVIVAALQEHIADMEPSAELAEVILNFMFSGKLSRYSEKQTRLDVLLKDGTYNCVSSAVFYMILAKAAGLDAWGVKTIDHAFIRVTAGDADYDVETTNPYGFNPGLKKEFKDEFGNVTGFNYVPPGNYKNRTDINSLELLGLILQNRITFYSEKHQYAEAVGLAADYWQVLNGKEAYEVMINSFLNMWTIYNTKSNFAEGIDFYDVVIEQFSQDERLLTNRENLTHNYLLTLINNNEITKAREIMEQRTGQKALSADEVKRFNTLIVMNEAQKASAVSFEKAVHIIKEALQKYGEDKDLLKQKAAYVHNMIAELIQKNELDTAYKMANQYKTAGDLAEKDWKELMIPIYQKRASLHTADYLKAAAVLQEGIAELGRDPGLVKNYEAYIHNYEVAVHNQMVTLYNNKEYAKAKNLLEDALKKLPESKRLKSDLEMVVKVTG